MLRRAIAALLIAVEFLTVIPTPGTRDYSPRSVGLSLVWFPIVGLLIGCLLVAVDLTASSVSTRAVTVALVLTTSAIVTGALHLDGLADLCDGVFGGRTPEHRLEIMKDSRIGTYGLVAVVLALLLQYSALASIGDSERRLGLLTIPMVSRLGMVCAIYAFPYVRASGVGRTYKEQVTTKIVMLAILITIVAAVLLFQVAGLVQVLTGVAIAWIAGRFFARTIGGLSGDTYGAIAVLIEVVLFVLLASHPPDW